MSRKRTVLSAVPFSDQSRSLSKPPSSTISTQTAMPSPISSRSTSVHPSEPSSHAASPSPSPPHSPSPQPKEQLRLFIVSASALTDDLVQLSARIDALRSRTQARLKQQLTLPQMESPPPTPLPTPSLPPKAWPRDSDAALLLAQAWPSFCQDPPAPEREEY